MANDSDGLNIPLFGARKTARKLQDDLTRLGGMTVVQREAFLAGLDEQVAAAQARVSNLQIESARLERLLVDTQDAIDLQLVGVFDETHPVQDSVAWAAELKFLQDQIKAMARANGGALVEPPRLTLDGSTAQGRKLVRDVGKLILRAYNAEADKIVRAMQPYKLATSRDRLEKARVAIDKLGVHLALAISNEYHRLRLSELDLTARFLDAKAQEKERQREERERLCEEKRVEQELANERAALDKERLHLENALARLVTAPDPDPEAGERMRARLAEIGAAIEAVDYRAANVKAGYVYVISNIGSFGPEVVKIGMTRRLEPMDRVHELGDASVPFRFDVHTLFFTNNAVSIEAELHRRFEDRRLNRVNRRREFFKATPDEVREALAGLAGDILEFTESAEAAEWRQSGGIGGDAAAPPINETPSPTIEGRRPASGTTEDVADLESVAAGVSSVDRTELVRTRDRLVEAQHAAMSLGSDSDPEARRKADGMVLVWTERRAVAVQEAVAQWSDPADLRAIAAAADVPIADVERAAAHHLRTSSATT